MRPDLLQDLQTTASPIPQELPTDVSEEFKVGMLHQIDMPDFYKPSENFHFCLLSGNFQVNCGTVEKIWYQNPLCVESCRPQLFLLGPSIIRFETAGVPPKILTIRTTDFEKIGRKTQK